MSRELRRRSGGAAAPEGSDTTSGGQLGATVTAAALDDGPARTGRHAGAEAVLLGAATVVRLERALHGGCPPWRCHGGTRHGTSRTRGSAGSCRGEPPPVQGRVRWYGGRESTVATGCEATPTATAGTAPSCAKVPQVPATRVRGPARRRRGIGAHRTSGAAVDNSLRPSGPACNVRTRSRTRGDHRGARALPTTTVRLPDVFRTFPIAATLAAGSGHIHIIHSCGRWCGYPFSPFLSGAPQRESNPGRASAR